MRNVDMVGAGLILIGIFLLVAYGIYMFVIAEDIPYFIRAGMLIAAAGVMLILLSLIWEKVKEG